MVFFNTACQIDNRTNFKIYNSTTMRRRNNKKNKKNKNKTGRAGYNLSPTSYTNFESTSIGFLDPHKYVRLKYDDVFIGTLATVTAQNQIMRLNSIFDPDLTGTGHQPYGYDQLSALYNRYRVLKTSWKISFHSENVGFFICVIPTNGNLATAVTNLASFTAACEVPYATTRIQGNGANSVVMINSIELNKLNGTLKVEYLADDRFEAQIGANPSELLILNICVFNSSGSTLSLDYSVEIEYFVDLHDPILVAQS